MTCGRIKHEFLRPFATRIGDFKTFIRRFFPFMGPLLDYVYFGASVQNQSKCIPMGNGRFIEHFYILVTGCINEGLRKEIGKLKASNITVMAYNRCYCEMCLLNKDFPWQYQCHVFGEYCTFLDMTSLFGQCLRQHTETMECCQHIDINYSWLSIGEIPLLTNCKNTYRSSTMCIRRSDFIQLRGQHLVLGIKENTMDLYNKQGEVIETTFTPEIKHIFMSSDGYILLYIKNNNYDVIRVYYSFFSKRFVKY